MNIVIFGSSGLIGSNLIKYFEKNTNYNIYAVSRLKLISNERVTYLNYLNFTDFIPKKINFLIYTTGLAHKKFSKSYIYEINVGLLRTNLKKLNNHIINKFIYLSTLKVLGDYGQFNIESIPNPQSDYAISKFQAENLIINKFKNTDTKITILRLPVVLSRNPKGSLKLMKMFSKSRIPLPLGNINNSKSVISIDSICRCFNDIIKILKIIKKFTILKTKIYQQQISIFILAIMTDQSYIIAL